MKPNSCRDCVYFVSAKVPDDVSKTNQLSLCARFAKFHPSDPTDVVGFGLCSLMNPSGLCRLFRKLRWFRRFLSSVRRTSAIKKEMNSRW